MLDTASPKASFLDTVLWSLPSTGKFTVKSYFLHLSSSVGNSSSSLSDCNFPWNIIWKSQAPLKVSSFVWEACQGKILTFDNLQKRGKILVYRCFIRKNGLETTDHLLLHCPIVGFSLWLLGLTLVMPSSVSHQLSMWEGFFRRRAKFKVFRAIHHAIFWLLWIGRVFDGMESSLERFKDQWLKTIFFWEEEVFCFSLLEVINFVDSLFLGCN